MRFLERRRVGSQWKRFWLMQCDCGIERELPYSAFASGTTRSCGCLMHEVNTTHGASSSPLYKVWSAMIERCRSPRNPSWADYGGRGIAVCERWLRFENFACDMGERPAGGTLERGDVNGHYEPTNCRWDTPRAQANNRRTNTRIEHAGLSFTLAEWARRAGVSNDCMAKRIAAGWPMERAITAPSDRVANVRISKAR